MPSGPKPAIRSDRYHHGDLPKALVDAALAHGADGDWSLRQLAAEIGVSAAAVYRHFDGKQAFLDHLAAQGFERMSAALSEAFDIERPPADADEARLRVQRLAAAYLSFAEREPSLWALMFSAGARAYRALATPAGRPSTYDYLRAMLHGLYTTGLTGTPPRADDEIMAWSLIHGLAALRLGRVPSAQAPIVELAGLVAGRILATVGRGR